MIWKDAPLLTLLWWHIKYILKYSWVHTSRLIRTTNRWRHQNPFDCWHLSHQFNLIDSNHIIFNHRIKETTCTEFFFSPYTPFVCIRSVKSFNDQIRNYSLCNFLLGVCRRQKRFNIIKSRLLALDCPSNGFT